MSSEEQSEERHDRSEARPGDGEVVAGKGEPGAQRESSLGRRGRNVDSDSPPPRVEITTIGPAQLEALKRRAAARAAREKAEQSEKSRKENE
ncbi:MAG: hypothetical protein WEB05_06920 [Solirubrobacterales bacterium]